MRSFKNFAEVRAGLSAGEFSVPDLVAYYLNRIQSHSNLNAFLEVFDQESATQAIAIQQKIDRGNAGRLAGMVVGIKDVLCYKNHSLTAGSAILNGFTSQFTASAIQRLIDEDAIIIGRQNCDEFAMGSSNENPTFGPVRNYADQSRVSGGSSGGSAVAVQADLCFASIGSDTGGSVRQPASFCGVVGLKPTYGRISRYGLVAYGSSFDCVGPITRSVADAALLLEIMAGSDGMDSTCSAAKVPAFSNLAPQKTPTSIACIKLPPGIVQPEILMAYQSHIDRFIANGHQIEWVELPYLDYVLPAYYILTTAEASTNLARYDGIRYGYRHPDATNLEQVYKMSRSAGFGKEVKKRIMVGTFILSAGYFDAYYTKAQKVRRLIRDSADQIFTRSQFLLMPSTPSTAFEIGEKRKDSLAMYYADIFTVWANLAGIPAVSIPTGTDQAKLPIGIQVHSQAFCEAELLSFAHWNMENH